MNPIRHDPDRSNQLAELVTDTHRESAGSSLNLHPRVNGEDGSGVEPAPIPSFLRVRREARAGGGGAITPNRQLTPVRNTTLILRNLAGRGIAQQETPEITVADLEAPQPIDTDLLMWARAFVWFAVILLGVVAYFGLDWS